MNKNDKCLDPNCNHARKHHKGRCGAWVTVKAYEGIDRKELTV